MKHTGRHWHLALTFTVSLALGACSGEQHANRARPSGSQAASETPAENKLPAANSPPAPAPGDKPASLTSAPLPPATCGDPESHATSFDELALSYDGESEFQNSVLSPEVKELVGQRVCLRGWISATSVRGQKSTSFVLVRHNGKCCFGQGAPPSDNVQVTMDPGGFVTYTEAPIQVEGLLSLRPWTGPDGLVWSVYHLQASAARP